MFGRRIYISQYIEYNESPCNGWILYKLIYIPQYIEYNESIIEISRRIL